MASKFSIFCVHNLPRWWNGRHWGLKIPWGQLRAGSSPAPGIVFLRSFNIVRWNIMIEFYPNSIYYPREAVDEKLAKGELEKTKKHLIDWTERHRDEIWECAHEDAEQPSDEILLDNLRALLLCKGSLQPAAEMGAMIREITKEVWYQNENGPKDPQSIAMDWQTKYMTKWREARMFEAFVLIEKNAKQLVEILRK